MKKIVALFFVLSSVQLSAQDKTEKIKIGSLAGCTFYKHNELKSINQNIIDQLPFDANIIDDFEPTINFGAYMQYLLFSRFYFGPAYEYHYSGSRLATKDYSGTFSFNQYVRKHQIGLKIDYSLVSQSKTNFKIELNTGANLTDWKMDSRLIIGDNDEYSEFQYDKIKGVSWYISPALKNEFLLIPQVHFVGAIGYFFDLFKNYHYIENDKIDVVKSPNWGGFKLHLGIEYSFN